MNWEVFITCAVTGSGDTVAKSPHVPVTPEQIADAAIGAAKAGAAGGAHPRPRPADRQRGARNRAVRRGRRTRPRSGTDVVLNLTAGMGGDMVLGGDETCCRSTPTAPTWPEPPNGSTTCARCCPRSARSTAAP